jgi:signal transduction histidine kinase
MKPVYQTPKALILMVVSQILLTGFVFQWLISQHNAEIKRLSGELDQIYLSSHDEMIDSILYRQVVKPALSGTKFKSGTTNTNFKRLKKSANTFAFGIQSDSLYFKKKEPSIITLRVNKVKDTTKSESNATVITEAGSDFLLRSVRLFIGNSKDTIGSFNELGDSILMYCDTAIFRTSFTRRLFSSGKHFKITWSKTSAEQEHSKIRSAMIISPGTGFNLPGAFITGYQGYIIRNITPQIIFGLILVVITGLAFFVAYKNLRNQMILNKIREEFINNMTHELKTPVSTVKIALESLLRFNMKNDPAVTEEYLNLASLETNRLENLINKVLDQTFLEGNFNPVSFQKIDLFPLIEEVIRIMTPRLEGRGSINFIPEKGGLFLIGDRLLLQGVLLNLVDNSIKYNDKIPEITIKSKESGGNVEITVTDNGPGIPVEFRKRIFEKFFRIPSGNIHNAKGYGLGLSFAALVMKIHKGVIELLPDNKGCSFILKFPAT